MDGGSENREPTAGRAGNRRRRSAFSNPYTKASHASVSTGETSHSPLADAASSEAPTLSSEAPT